MEKNQTKTTEAGSRTADAEYAASEVAQREEAVLTFWREHDIFNKSIAAPAGQEPVGDFVFYDGPPFATGLPHYGHILASTIKDAVPRFWTMNGYRVRRKWGWDCHGLPLENLIEKKLGLATKRDIEEYGVKNFNEAARGAVMEFADDWKRIIPRMGRFADMDDDYKTMDSTYTESVWWVFKALAEKGLVYEGFKSMHLCPRCGTTLSNFEVNQGYQDIKDISVTVKLPLVEEPETSLLVWTTTPWTLPGNMAAAVHEDGDYVKVRVERKLEANNLPDEKIEVHETPKSEFVILAKSRLEEVINLSQEYLYLETVDEFKGVELVGKSYTPPFNYFQNKEFENKENAWKICFAPYVELEGEGTGAVHLAPAYGEDDMELAKEIGLPIEHHVGQDGRFMDFVTDFAGQLVKPKDDDDAGVLHLDADIEVVKYLKEHGSLFRKDNIVHSYPHCWRCDTPLLNYATTSWFVRVTDIKDKLVAENNAVHWVPEHVGKNRFGRWLEGARDWAVSRQRYWGAPLPVWRNPETKDVKIFGSLAELQEYVPKSGNQYLVMRHGESESNIDGVISTDVDHTDSLTEAGRDSVVTAANDLKEHNIDLIVTSPFHRTKETAEIVRETLGLTKEQLIVDERMQELQVTDELQGKSWDEHKNQYTDFTEEFTKEIEGMETRADVQRRTGEFLYELEREHKGKTILIVGHVSSTYALACAAVGADIETAVALKQEIWLKNAEVKHLTFTPLPHNDDYVLDFHRPYIDEVELYEGETKLERVKDVFDCWFESGSMPYAQLHYPFEHKDEFLERFYPANFIAESIDQTRGWFYSLIVLGVALFGKSPYQNVVTNGLVLAEDGKKMSKKLQNYPDPVELVDRLGADSMRFYLLSSPIIKGEDLNFTEKDVAELQRKNIGRLHNVLAMYQQYEGGEAASADSKNVLDRWILARLYQLIGETTAGYKNYELDKATRPITDFIDDLSVWYLRRSRERLKGEDAADKQASLATLRYVFQQLALVMAPSMPFYADYLWRAIKEEDDAESVHLAAWPDVTAADPVVLGEMSVVREFVSIALETRAQQGIKVRQPLPALYTKVELEPEYAAVVADEVNVKEVVFDESIEERAKLDITVTPELKAEGEARELIRAIQDMRKKAGLNADDRIALTITSSESGEALVDQYQQQIKRTVGADELTYVDVAGTEVNTGDHTFVVSFEVVKK